MGWAGTSQASLLAAGCMIATVCWCAGDCEPEGPLCDGVHDCHCVMVCMIVIDGVRDCHRGGVHDCHCVVVCMIVIVW